MKLKTHIFNVRLYVEGLKRLRVLGFGVLILALTFAALVPVTHMMTARDRFNGYDYAVKDLPPVSYIQDIDI